MNSHPEDIEYILPQGDKLRELLSQTFIAPVDLKHLLRERGVYVASNEKSAYIPILSATLLSPREFAYLCDCWSEKEDNLKITTDIVPWKTGCRLMDALPNDLEVSGCIVTDFKNFSVLGSPTFTNGDNDDTVVLEFQIQRNDLAKNWISIEKKYSGWVEIAKVDENHIRLTTTYTSDETLDVARGIKSKVLGHFVAEHHIPHAAKVETVQLSSFDNSGRVEFLCSLSSKLTPGWLTFQDIVDVELRPDTSAPLPENMRWMHDKISEMRMRGQSLHQLFVLNDNACHPHLQLFQIDARFQFELSYATGQCVLSLGFPGWRDSADAPMVLKVAHVTFDPEYRHVSKARAIREILSRAERLKIATYALFKKVAP